jgi:hypothetical protein
MIIDQITVSFSLSQEKHYAFVQSGELQFGVMDIILINSNLNKSLWRWFSENLAAITKKSAMLLDNESIFRTTPAVARRLSYRKHLPDERINGVFSYPE